jgi:hypothetical protein
MPWYGVRMLFEIKHGHKEPVKNKLYSDSIFVVKARNEDRAVKKTIDFALVHEEASYKNYLGETVVWKIKKLMDVHEIFQDEIKEFTEVYSCLYRGWYPKLVRRSRKISVSELKKRTPKKRSP